MEPWRAAEDASPQTSAHRQQPSPYEQASSAPLTEEEGLSHLSFVLCHPVTSASTPEGGGAVFPQSCRRSSRLHILMHVCNHDSAQVLQPGGGNPAPRNGFFAQIYVCEARTKSKRRMEKMCV